MRKISILIFVFLNFLSVAFAEDTKYRELILEPGYTFYFTDDYAGRINEYSSSKPSGYFLFSFKDYFPKNKIMFKSTFYEKDERELDFTFLHADNVLLEFSEVAFVHNLEHKQLLVNPLNHDFNPGTKYHLDIIRKFANIKIKPFEYPAHIRLFVEDIERDGTVQKRFYGARSFDVNILSLPPALRNYTFSRDRQIGLEIQKVVGLIDAIIGGVGIAAQIGSENFTNKDHNSPDYLLNYPNINKAHYELKLYSNLTGQLSWSLALSRRDANNHSRDEIGRKGASVTQTDTKAMLTYYPTKNLKFSLKLAYDDRDQSNPDTVRFMNKDFVGIKDAVSFQNRVAEFKGLYKLSPEFNVMLTLRRKEIERSFNDFNLPEYSHTNTGILSFDGKLRKDLSYKISQKIENNHNPSYKKVPEMFYQTKLNLSWDINQFFGVDWESEYSFGRNDVENAFFRKNWQYNHMITFWLNPKETLNLNIYGAYNNEKYISDLHFGSTAPTFFIDRNVPFQMTMMQAGLNLNKQCGKKNLVFSDLFYMRGYGTYYPHFTKDTLIVPPNPPYTFDTIGLDSIAATDFYQYGIVLGNKYIFNKDTSISCKLGYSDHIEKIKNPIEGTVKTIFLSLEKKW